MTSYLVKCPFEPYDWHLLSDDAKTRVEQIYSITNAYPSVFFEVVNENELQALVDDYDEKTFKQGLPKLETEDDYYYALGVLPPSRYSLYDGIEAFFVSEAVKGDYYRWHACSNDVFFTWCSKADMPVKEVRAKYNQVLVNPR